VTIQVCSRFGNDCTCVEKEKQEAEKKEAEAKKEAEEAAKKEAEAKKAAEEAAKKEAEAKKEPEKKGDPPVIEGKLEDVVSWC